ncbi:MAG: glycoside hydrolase family 3 N-terminal domain-containing protein [Micropruina sp.]
MPGPHLTTYIAPDGTAFRDLDHDGVMAPFEDPRLTPAERAEDLLPRLSLAEKAGLMFQTVIESGPGGTLLTGPGHIAAMGTSEMVCEMLINHANVHGLGSARESARWSNAVQALAEQTPHSIPVTISTDPRHSFAQNAGAAFAAGAMSEWPEPLGLGALDDVETVRRFADVARQEYLAVGIRAALHPQIDLGTEPRWGRQYHTFGENAERVAEFAAAYLEGFQGSAELGPQSVACMAKHFPGGGPQRDGEDPHFPYGREQVYPGGRFEDHLIPFKRAIAEGVSALMPYYGMPIGLELDGEPVEEVGFGFNKQIITGLLRERLGYDGVICTDWSLVTDTYVGPQVLPARAWGCEHLDRPSRMAKVIEAGVDQFGGEECPELLLSLVAEGRVSEARLDESVRRLLLVKFQLGMFDDPFVDEDEAERIVGNAEFRAEGLRAQAESMVLLSNREVDGRPVLPLAPGTKVYVEGFEAPAGLGVLVADPAEADVAVVRVPPPFDPRDDLFLEAFFHQGSLEYRPGLVSRLRRLAEVVPVVLNLNLERPAIIAPLAEFASAIVADFGTSPVALVDVLTSAVPPRGTVPFEIPRSMDAVRASRSDVPSDSADPLYPCRSGLRYAD